MVKYLRSLPFGGCVWGSGVRLDGGAPLPSFFEVAFQLFNPSSYRLHLGDVFLFAVAVDDFLAFVIEFYSHLMRLGIVGWPTHFLCSQIITSLWNFLSIYLRSSKVKRFV